MLNKQQFYLFGRIQTSQTGGQPYSDTPSFGGGSLDHCMAGLQFNWIRFYQRRKHVVTYLYVVLKLNPNH